MCRIKVHLFLLLQILSSFATLLRKQDASVWTYPSTLQAYHGLLSFTVHSKPKVCLLRSLGDYQLSSPLNKHECLNLRVFQVRKAAQQGVCAVLRGSDFLFTDNAPAHHPAAVSTAKFCIKEMEHAGGETGGWRLCLVTYPAFLGAVQQNLSLWSTASLRQQRGHYHSSRAGPPEGADGDVSSGGGQILLRDSAASDDTQPCGERQNVHNCSQVLPSWLVFFHSGCSACFG